MASSGPSPMTTVPSIAMTSNAARIASTAAVSADTSSPRPMCRAEASAAASVTRTRSIARFRSICEPSDAEQTLHQRVCLWDEDTLLAGVALVVAPLHRTVVLLVAGHVQRERLGVGRAGPLPAGRRMMRQHHHPPLAPARPEPLEQRAEHFLVEALDGLDLPLRVARATVVGRRDVQEEEVALVQDLERAVDLRAQIGVRLALAR